MKGRMLKVTILALLALGLLAACGGGGGGTNGSPAVPGTISGNVIKGPVAGATVTAYAIEPDGTLGTRLGEGRTDGTGYFSFRVGEYSGPVHMEASGGRYIDEATGVETPYPTGDTLFGAIPFMEQGAIINGVQVTPLTAMAETMAEHMAGGLTGRNISAANSAMGRYFLVDDILYTWPMNPLIANSGDGATRDEEHYGMTVAAISMYSHMQGIVNSSDMVSFMAQDASDGWMDGRGWDGSNITMGGMMDGRMGGGMTGGGTMMSPDAGTLGLYDAMHAFINSPNNLSGITVEDMYDLMYQLQTSNGYID